MKKIFSFKIILLLAIVFVSTNCSKEAPATGTVPFVPPPPPNRPPLVNAGNDFSVGLFNNYITLTGHATDPDKNSTLSFIWTKIAGPACTIISPQSLTTEVTNLLEGEYLFELVASDTYGATDKDTVVVKTIRLLDRQVVFYNLTWIFPWYNAIEIPHFYSFIPTGNTPFRIYIQRDSNPGWIEVDPIAYTTTSGPYEYFIETRPHGAGMYHYGSLYIFYYGMDVSDSPDVKIVF
ncbi:hypothetical protein CAP36_16250 [Chitinophagaceae bacterium IBVUCB2]|nr:hypothetical protein CAP36_16250 [Chitinophagaceae bacterium IBVUCB2]